VVKQQIARPVRFNGSDQCVTKRLFDYSPEAKGHSKIFCGGTVCAYAGVMIGAVALAVEVDPDAVDIHE
jgi:hypothetical protein